ncbi:hypothetical protein B0H39_005895 [Clostridium beijerinckii]|uniref:class I SAM-dependent methyltransferase n=1 Tax=Clostridium beijerinckii TaxID=1520 RepID=UPI0014941FAC|nr:class I SAM-dependent methyltransferase [Clostridium beijerinckii]NOW87864.1 hypothetical protein [Clostridium beijerinckii]
MNIIEKCEVCKNTKLKTVLNLGVHPMCDDLVEINNERICKEYPIEILYCEKCYTAHQKYQIPKEDLFPKEYHYRAQFTSDVLRGMMDLVDSCKEKYGDIKDKLVVDIGCNDGSLLDAFLKEGCKTIGVEPTDAYKDAILKEHEVFNNYFNENVSKEIVEKYGKPDFITFTNVFAHIENLPELLNALKVLIGENTVVIIENHYLGSVLRSAQFDTFYHEHPRTYSLKSFVFIAESMGMFIGDVRFPSRYGGNIRVYMSNKIGNNERINEILKEEESFEKEFKKMVIGIEKWKVKKHNIIKEYVDKYGKLKAKAFPGRAAILVKLLEVDENMISAIYEKPGSKKIGNYLPGTRIPIVSDELLFERENDGNPIINLAWHISSEIEEYLRKNGYNGEQIDILEKSDLEE